MKTLVRLLILSALIAGIVACANTPDQGTAAQGSEAAPLAAVEQSAAAGYAGTYIGYAWAGEAKGTSLAEAPERIETILTLDRDAVITDARLLFWKKVDGHWIPRQSGNAKVEVDFSVTPTAAVPGEGYKKGNSMFRVDTIDMMSFYATAVSEAGVAAVLVVDPNTRYQFEMKLPARFDYSTPIKNMTIGSGALVPTVRTSSSGLLRPKDWAELQDNYLFDIHPYSYVLTGNGVLRGLDEDSTMREFLERLGVEFDGGNPKALKEKHGFTSMGGWAGNYRAIEQFLIGKSALELRSLVDWSVPRWAGGINANNHFGVEAVSGATRTAQNSYDTISGATVRMSRESTSYQRALVEAGILSEREVVKGRF